MAMEEEEGCEEVAEGSPLEVKAGVLANLLVGLVCWEASLVTGGCWPAEPGKTLKVSARYSSSDSGTSRVIVADLMGLGLTMPWW